jgi:hypothetical protein
VDYNDNVLLCIQRICIGKLIFYHNDKRLLLSSPSNEVKYESEILYEKIIEDHKFEEVLRKNHLDFLLKKLDIWDEKDQEILKGAEKKLEDSKLMLYNNRLNKQKKEKIKSQIEETKTSINRLLARKHSLDYLTLEEYAVGKKMEFIFINTIYNNNNELFFSQDFNNVDYSEFNSITSEISNHLITIEQYKKIARSENWKTIWNANKNNVFPKPSSELTDEQKSLINISIMYDRIYEHHEAPESYVIEDDDMLDGWMIYQKKKAEAANKQNQAQDILSKHANAKEIFIVGDQSDSEGIYSLNSMDSTRILKQRKNMINSSQDGVDEVALPDVQSELLQKINKRH